MNIRDIDLNLLLVFEAIYSARNISQAAKYLELSQPAVSNALKRLRLQLDDQLFVREGNGVVPTARAEAMIEPIKSSLAAIQHGLSAAEPFNPQTSKRHFRLIVADPLEPIIMPELLNNITNDTQITYEFLPPQRVHIEDALIQDKIDLAVFLMPNRTSEILSEQLIPIDTVLLAREGHPRIEGFVTPEQLVQENHIGLLLAPGKLENSDKVRVWQKLKQRTICNVSKVSSIAKTVSATDLIGFAPRIYAEHVAEHYKLQIIKLETQLSNQYFHMVWHNRNDGDESHLWLRDKIKAAILPRMSE